MEKKTYAANYVPQSNMTGISGRQLRAGEAYPANHFLNIDEHIAAGHILDEETHNKNVEAAAEALKKAAEKEKGEPTAATASAVTPAPKLEEKKDDLLVFVV